MNNADDLLTETTETTAPAARAPTAAETPAAASPAADPVAPNEAIAPAPSDRETATAAPVMAASGTAPNQPIARAEPASDERTTGVAATGEPADEEPASEGFNNLGLDAKLVKSLADLGYEEPSPIQREAIPLLLTGRDVIGQAATGTGKTAAFALPMIQRIAEAGRERKRPSALVLVPTRELAMQVAEATQKYGRPMAVTAFPIYGGHSFGQQASVLKRGVDVVVATPGRALDHIRRGTMDLTGIRVLALDEADEMLDMGFAEDLESILSETPAERQTVLFSATLPPRIAGMVKRHLRDPLRVQIATVAATAGTSPKVRQTAYVVPRNRKLEVLGRVLDLENPPSTLVFCRTRHEVDSLSELLNSHGYRAQSLHGGITQDQRSRVVKRLKEGSIDLVVATDVAARGLDIENLALVVNFDVPTSPEAYVHRIGRVGRAGREGIAITLADPRESRLLRLFERQTKGKIEIAMVPTIADLRAKRLEMTRAAVREAVLAGGLDRYRVAVESLAQEYDLMTIALAAMKLAHRAGGGERDDEEDGDEDDRPTPQRRPAAGGGRDGGPGSGYGQSRGDGPGRDGGGRDGPSRDVRPRPAVEARPAAAAPPPPRPAPPPRAPMTRVYVGVGRLIGAGPEQIVTAITRESGVPADKIGTVELADKFSIVEMEEAIVEPVIKAMRKYRFSGRKITVRRYLER
jgi:ATP-dependent RNA helicase DeaD